MISNRGMNPMILNSKTRNLSLRKARECKISRNSKILCHNVNALVTKKATQNPEGSKFKFESRENYSGGL